MSIAKVFVGESIFKQLDSTLVGVVCWVTVNSRMFSPQNLFSNNSRKFCHAKESCYIRDSYGGGKTWDIPPKNPFSIDIIWHNYNNIRLFFSFKMSSISLKSTLLMLGPSIAIFIKCSKFESERRLRRRAIMSFI